jgi:hypothetical protein
MMDGGRIAGPDRIAMTCHCHCRRFMRDRLRLGPAKWRQEHRDQDEKRGEPAHAVQIAHAGRRAKLTQK